MAKFEKGNKYGKGRPTGSRNIITQDLRENFQMLVESNIEQMQADIDSLEPYERIKIILQISRYVLPQLRTIEIERLTPKEELRHYTDEELHKRIKELATELNWESF